MDTMKQLAVIAQGNADYVDRLRELLEATDIDPEEFTGLEYFGLTPFFVMAGATVRPQAHTHGDDIHVEAVVVELADDLPEDWFYAQLQAMLYDAYGDDEQE
jgi:hypothetical protein